MKKVLVVSILILAVSVQGCFKFTEKCVCPEPSRLDISMVRSIYPAAANHDYSIDQVNMTCSPIATDCLPDFDCECKSTYFVLLEKDDRALKIPSHPYRAKCNETSKKWYYESVPGVAEYLEFTATGCFSIFTYINIRF